MWRKSLLNVDLERKRENISAQTVCCLKVDLQFHEAGLLLVLMLIIGLR